MQQKKKTSIKKQLGLKLKFISKYLMWFTLFKYKKVLIYKLKQY